MSLRIKIILLLFFPAIVSTTYLFYYFIPAVEEDSRQTLIENVELRLTTMKEGLIPSIKKSQYDIVSESLKAILAKNRDLISISLFVIEDDRVFAVANPTAVDVRTTKTLESAIVLDGEKIGRLRLEVDLGEKLKAMRAKNLGHVGGMGAVAFFGLFIVALLLDYLIRQPVQRLAEAAQQLADGNFRATLPKPRNDEIGVMIKSFLLMRDSVLKNKEDQIEANERLSRQVEQHKWLLEALKESEAALGKAQRVAHIGSWDWNIALGRHSWSKEIYRLLDIDSEDVAASLEAYLVQTHPDDRDKVEEVIQGAAKNGKPIKIEHRIKLSDGNERIVEMQGEVELDENNRPRLMVGVVLDITERKKAEEERERLLETITSRLREMGCLYGVTRLLVSQDQAIDSVCERAVYQIPDSWQYPDVACASIEIKGKLYKTENYKKTEWRQSVELNAGEKVVGSINVCYLEKRPDMDEGPFRKEERELLNALGAQLGAFIERKWAEDKLEYARRKEKIAVEELKHTLELSEELRAEAENAKVLAEEYAEETRAANKSKSEFLANMSHELRTPLNGIIGLTELLLVGGVSAEERKKLELIRFSGDTLLTLVNDILDLTKIEEGKLELDRTEFDLRETVEKTAEQLAVTAHEKKLEFLVSVAKDVPEKLMGDPHRLRQIIINLMGNAIKFTDEGEILTGVDVSSFDGDLVELHFYVKDTGVGISEDRQEAVFQRFTQEDTSITRKYGGAGLGTTISKQLVNMMQGDIWLESELGKGSVFHFTAKLEVARKATSRSLVAGKRKAALRALVIDDNKSCREILEKLLISWDISAQIAGSGEEGIALIGKARKEKKPFDFLLVDFGLPYRDGIAVAKEARSVAKNKELKVILLSTGPNIDWRRNKAKIDVCLEKPVKMSELFETLESFLGGDQEDYVAKRKTTKAISAGVGLSVLLVEDNLVNQEVAQGALVRLGHKVTVANNGKIGVEKWEKGAFDLILMDVQMPIMDGLTATTKIREMEQPGGKRVPIIAMTANAMSGDRERCLEAGMDDYLPKPVTLGALSGMVAHISASQEPDTMTIAEATEETPAVEEATDDSGKGSAPTYDLSDIKELLGGNEEKVKKIAGSFLSTTQKNVSELETALKSDDSSVAHRMAHTIKGAASQVGAEGLRVVAFDMEQMGKEGRLSEIIDRMPELKEAFLKVKVEMEEDLR